MRKGREYKNENKICHDFMFRLHRVRKLLCSGHFSLLYTENRTVDTRETLISSCTSVIRLITMFTRNFIPTLYSICLNSIAIQKYADASQGHIYA